MIVYFDESYASKDRLLLGALFIPSHDSKKAIHKGLSKIKYEMNFVNAKGEYKEIKYSELYGRKRLSIAKKAVDLFFSRTDCYFRACVVPYSEEYLDKVGRQQGIPRKLKEAMLYTNSFIKLINNNIPEVKGAVLMMDQLTRARGDRFDEIVRDRLGSGENAIFKHIGYVDSASERNQSIQICDLLLGSILNDHYPTNTTYKNDLREYVKQKIGVTSLKEDYWGGKSHGKACNLHPKFTIRFWGVPYKYLNL